MKKAALFFAVLAVLAITACSTTDITTNRVGWSEYVDMAVKDFESLGIISLKSQVIEDVSPLYFMTTNTGSQITYASLFAEAAKLGADDIVNVRIDVQTQKRFTFFNWLIGSKTVHTYTGTALAVKYTNAVDRVKSSNQNEINKQ